MKYYVLCIKSIIVYFPNYWADRPIISECFEYTNKMQDINLYILVNSQFFFLVNKNHMQYLLLLRNCILSYSKCEIIILFDILCLSLNL